MRITLFSLLFFILNNLTAQTIQVSLFNSRNVNAYTLSVRHGKYLIKGNDEIMGEYKKNSIFFINRIGDKIEIRDKNAQIGVFKEVTISPRDENSVVALRGVNPTTPSREYTDELTFTASGGKLKAINNVDLEKYIAAVIEAEGGAYAPLEYYKAQGILVRTYTIKSIYKHAEEGFNLCDEVHCQAYHGRSAHNPEIYKATKATAGLVLVDIADTVMAMTPFHSSCGGHTSPAGIYWQKDLPYLKGIEDPFCTESRNAYWEKTIPTKEWNQFLRSKGVSNLSQFQHFHSEERVQYFSQAHNIKMRDIRTAFKLKSTFFNVEPIENGVVIKGKGYGHGIGMCQLGAMEMARVGLTYMDILHFYFQNVLITDYSEMDLTRY